MGRKILYNTVDEYAAGNKVKKSLVLKLKERVGEQGYFFISGSGMDGTLPGGYLQVSARIYTYPVTRYVIEVYDGSVCIIRFFRSMKTRDEFFESLKKCKQGFTFNELVEQRNFSYW